MNKKVRVEIKESTYERLKSHTKIKQLAEFVDTVVSQVLDLLEGKPKSPGPSSDNLQILKHTKVLSASIDGNEVSTLHWNPIRNELISIAFQQGKDIDWIRQRAVGKIVEGNKAPHNYQYLPDCGISVIQTNSQNAGQTLINIARDLSIPVKIEFKWKDKKGASRPGETTVLRIDKGKVIIS